MLKSVNRIIELVQVCSFVVSMQKQPLDIEKIKAAYTKMSEDKKAVVAYMRGEITQLDLKKRGIQLAKPI